MWARPADGYGPIKFSIFAPGITGPSRANEFLAPTPQDGSAAELVGPVKFCWEQDSPVKKDSTRRLPNAALSPSRVIDEANFGGRCSMSSATTCAGRENLLFASVGRH